LCIFAIELSMGGTTGSAQYNPLSATLFLQILPVYVNVRVSWLFPHWLEDRPPFSSLGSHQSEKYYDRAQANLPEDVRC
jgi:hypothetical protein